VPANRASQMSIEDVLNFIGEPEGRHLEFKEDIPVSKEENRRQLKENPDARPADQSWIKNRRLADFGRNALLGPVRKKSLRMIGWMERSHNSIRHGNRRA
jgi:hypothetical protein